ncbi:NAD(P)H-dependent flavin oxidoreductase [Chachezhania antarctica]|uniref:NAD(P)H-dependent flavin oxidoreductase n=1 Tax=Chachezhania antarctica TaxID=2340860 RepID=UPI000EB3082B|nr:nitronate monooxygenase [Chachezhania antarctica]|tara:strand:- start:4178 stop:5176 length:999 start_codon:yes stop_codon:yes gene_type:complete
MFRTRLTELFGMRFPIIVGGMMWHSKAAFVAACARAGAMAFLTPKSHDSPDAFEADLVKCLELAQGAPVGVNFSISRFRSNEINDTCLAIAQRHGVTRFETAGSHPGEMIARIHDGGGVLIHKSTQLRHAVKAAQSGVDAIAIVGMEAGGHPGINPHPGHVILAQALKEIDVPIALGGGIGTGRQILGVLAQGGEAAVVVSRFLASTEIEAHPNYKARMVAAGMDSTVAVLHAIKDTWRVLDNETARRVQQMERELGEAARHADFGDMVSGRHGRDWAYIAGDVDRGLVSMSSAVAHADCEEPAGDIVAKLAREMEVAWEGLAGRHACAVSK